MKRYRFQVPRAQSDEVNAFIDENNLRGNVTQWNTQGTVYQLRIPDDVLFIMKLKYGFSMMCLPDEN
jgi:hypothetical protein